MCNADIGMNLERLVKTTAAVISDGCGSCFWWLLQLFRMGAVATGNGCGTQREWKGERGGENVREVEMGGGIPPFLKLSKKYVPCSIYEGVVKGTKNILYKSFENSSFTPPHLHPIFKTTTSERIIYLKYLLYYQRFCL